MTRKTPSYGLVETKVRQDVDALLDALRAEKAKQHPMSDSLAAAAFTLARTLDEGAGLAVAAVSRELRANLVELARFEVAESDELGDELSRPTVSAPVRDAPAPGAADARPRRRRGGSPAG